MPGGNRELIFPKHFDGKRFYNPAAQQASGLSSVIRWKLTSRPEVSPEFVDDVKPSVPPKRIEGSELRTTMVNHSTVLLQEQRFNILTDPIWSERASPLSWVGPRRHRKAGVELENLPAIDVVLLSHNHYDHLRSAHTSPAGVYAKVELCCTVSSWATAAQQKYRPGTGTRLG